MIHVYGVPGYGSTISELMLTMTGVRYNFINVDGFDKAGPSHDLLEKVNPLCQVPTLVLDDGQVMTETAAIALMLLDSHPQFAPAPGSPQRHRFLRLLVWMVANVYPTFTYADYPERWAAGAPAQLRESTARYRETLYRWLEEQVEGTPWMFGNDISLLDCYLPVMRRWSPREAWFAQHTPKLNAIADAVRGLPELQTVLRANQIL